MRRNYLVLDAFQSLNKASVSLKGNVRAEFINQEGLQVRKKASIVVFIFCLGSWRRGWRFQRIFNSITSRCFFPRIWVRTEIKEITHFLRLFTMAKTSERDLYLNQNAHLLQDLTSEKYEFLGNKKKF